MKVNYALKLFLLFLFFNVSCSDQNSNTIIIEDFESGSYSDWDIKGNAFGNKPAGGENTHQMIGVLGNGYACSAHFEEASAKGTLTSPSFQIVKKSIHFLIGSQEVHFLPGMEEYRGQQVIQLLVDDKLVRETIPKEFHAMFWDGWDVTEFIGKNAKIKIVDEDNRDWAHIDIDHIVQNDIPVNGKILERKLFIDAAKLNIPVNEKDPRYYVELYIDGKKVRVMDVAIATEEIDYWVVTDLSKWMGQDVTVRTLLKHEENPSLLDEITIKSDIINSSDLYREPLRQQFHFSSKRGWLNDPNGLVYYNGEFHLFYQHNPFGWDHSRNDYNKTWGHAVSKDLVHWIELPAAVEPDHLGSIYSGSAVVDINNTSGFKEGGEDPIVCIYTTAGSRNQWSLGKKFTQSLSYSTDGGKAFTKYSGNPVQENLGYINRDPKAFWYEPDKHWVIVLYLDHGAFVFFTSKDLKEWKEQSRLSINELGINEISAFEDCPELFELPVDGNDKNKKWIFYAGSGDYVVGDFNGKRFIPESNLIKYNFGNAFYASQTFNNVPAPDGRRIQIAWGLTPTPGMPFNMCLLFPVELTLHKTDDGIRMFGYPVEEISKLHTKEYSWNDINLDFNNNILSDIRTELLDINSEFIVGDKGEFGFKIKGKEILYDADTHTLTCDEQETKLNPVNNKIRIRILVDRLTIELFANEGSVYMPIRAYPEEKQSSLEIFSKKGDVIVNSLIVNELKSIWN